MPWTCHDSQRSRALRSLASSRSTFAAWGGWKFEQHRWKDRKSARTRGAMGVIIRWHKSTKVQVYLGGSFFGKNLLFLIGRDARLHKTL